MNTPQYVKDSIRNYALEEMPDDKYYSNLMFDLDERFNVCCGICSAVIVDVEYKFRSMNQHEWERDIRTLICGNECPRLPESHKCRCSDCKQVIDVGYYKYFVYRESDKCGTCKH